jgi:hypothetical protein
MTVSIPIPPVPRYRPDPSLFPRPQGPPTRIPRPNPST